MEERISSHKHRGPEEGPTMSTPENPTRTTKHYSPNDPPLDELFICTTCFHLTSKGATTQRCQCEPNHEIPGLDSPSGFHLCYICAVRVAGGTSRWTHEACSICLDANKSLREAGIALPLGRHSIMNGFAIPLNISPERFEELAGNLVGFINVMTLLGELAEQRTIRMFQTQGKWASVRLIPVRHWEKTFSVAKKDQLRNSQDLIREIVSNAKGNSDE
jgi:hypothetical protein